MGLLESIYETCLLHEIIEVGIRAERQKKLLIIYKGSKSDTSYWLDLLTDDRPIVELKSVEALPPVHSAQVLTYMKSNNIKYGLLLNLNVTSLEYGIKRFML